MASRGDMLGVPVIESGAHRGQGLGADLRLGRRVGDRLGTSDARQATIGLVSVVDAHSSTVFPRCLRPGALAAVGCGS